MMVEFARVKDWGTGKTRTLKVPRTTLRYASTLYHTPTLKELARAYLAALPKEVKTLVSVGSSGNSIATAMIALSRRNLYHLQVRKKGEDSHRSDAAGHYAARSQICAIVDDLMETGKSIEYVAEWMSTNELKLGAIIVSRYNDRDANSRLREHKSRLNLLPYVREIM